MNKDITLEDLGYELNYNSEEYINYKKIGALGNIKEIIIHNQTKDNGGLYINYSPENNGAYLCLDELQAIYNKCKELGCLDE